MSQALYRKWRPRLWDEVVGQEHVIRTLRNAIAGQRVAHAYLFAGPRGTGKTTTARLLAKAVNCLDENLAERPCNQCAHCQAVNEGRFMDLIEIDAASNTSVEDVRDLRDKINYSPSLGQFKVYIIDEVHMLSTAAFNALLKTLEEPPAHAIFILATTEVHKIPATVLSRCQRHEFRRIGVAEITGHLQQLSEQEHLDVDSEALMLIARQATGSMRDAISLLDQLTSSGQSLNLDLAHQLLGTATNTAIIELVEAILARDAATGLEKIHAALDGGTDSRQFARQIVEYLRGILMIRMGSLESLDVVPETLVQMQRQAKGFEANNIITCLRLFNTAATDLRGGWQPGLQLELAFAEAIENHTPVNLMVPNQKAVIQQPNPAATVSPQTAQPVPPAVSSTVNSDAGQKVNLPDTAAAEETTTIESLPGDNPAIANSAISFSSLMQQWPRIRALIKKHSPQTEALINSSKLIGIKDGALVVGLGSVLKQKMETGNHLQITAKAITHVTGVNLEVRCALLNAKGEDGGTQDLEVEDDGIVGTALRDMGGKVVDIQ